MAGSPPQGVLRHPGSVVSEVRVLPDPLSVINLLGGNVFSRIKAALVILMIALGVTIFGMASPASAAPEPPPSSCGGSMLCAYVNTGYQTNQGYELIPVDALPIGTCDTPSFPNAWSSLYNNSGRVTRLYKTTNCTGEFLTYTNGTGVTQLGLSHPTYNDHIRSYKFV